MARVRDRPLSALGPKLSVLPNWSWTATTGWVGKATPPVVNPPGPVATVMVTLIGEPVTGLPNPSSTRTAGAGEMATPAVVAVGCWVNTREAGAPGVMSNPFEVALARPLANAPSV